MNKPMRSARRAEVAYAFSKLSTIIADKDLDSLASTQPGLVDAIIAMLDQGSDEMKTAQFMNGIFAGLLIAETMENNYTDEWLDYECEGMQAKLISLLPHEEKS